MSLKENKNIVYLGLGSNLGDRLENLKNACRFLEENEVKILARSSVYESAPQEVFDEQPNYLNAVLKVETELSPTKLLRLTRKIEEKLGRKNKKKKQPRTLDIDILLFNDLILVSEDLTLPHPRIIYRDFVVYPLLEIEPELVYPIGNLKLRECKENLPENRLRKYADNRFVIMPSVSESLFRTDC